MTLTFTTLIHASHIIDFGNNPTLRLGSVNSFFSRKGTVLANISKQQLEKLDLEGYVIVEDLIDTGAILEPLETEYDIILNKLASKLHNEGKIDSTYQHLKFSDRLIQIFKETGKLYTQHFDISLPQKGVTYDTPISLGSAVFKAMTFPALLDIVQEIIGPEIYSNPTQHVRFKPPEFLAASLTNPPKGTLSTPWHQDNGVVTEEADNTNMLTVWFPVWDADQKSGCLRVIPRSHKEGLLQHCPGGTDEKPFHLRIPDTTIREEDAVEMPMRRGSVLFMHRLTCHESLPNMSELMRWSLDLRYNPIGQPTGREHFPGFIARSRSKPETELHDADIWAQQWYKARDQIAMRNDPTYNRWSRDAAACA